ncbi:alkylmercury lyase [Mycolicibacterium mucogenicum]|nr:alkylmercury lyase [Mycolicibacterium mucogenicum]
MRIELLSSPDCPHAAATRQLLVDALAAAGIADPIIERVGAYPSPTVLIDGRDVMRPGQPLRGQMCRLDLPTVDQLRAALA